MESTRGQETVGTKPYCLLRPSAFGSSSTTSATRDTDASHENESTSQTSSRFQLRPSMLDRQAATLFNKDAGASPTVSRSSAAFKLEPPKLCSPLSCKFTDNNKPSLLQLGADSGTPASDAPTGGDVAPLVPRVGDDTVPIPAASGAKDVDNTAQPSTVFKVTAVPMTDAAGFMFGQQMSSRVTGTGDPAGGTHVLPVPASTTAVTGDATATAASGFVFGSNCAERAIVVTSADHSEPTGAAGNTDSAAQATETRPTEPTAASVAIEPTTLVESAALQQAKQSHIELKEVEVVTGEENESNVFQVNVKLFVFEKKTQSWLERGIGLLRLNDKSIPSDGGSFQSRLVMRIQGSLRVVLNTMIWPGMLIERSTKKSIKISAVDPEDGIRIYLIQANPSDADHIFTAISSRAHKLKLAEAARSPSVSTTPTPPLDSPGGSTAVSASSSATCVSMTSTPVSEKRSSEAIADADTFASKRRRVDPDQRREQVEEESNDSSAVDPETEASNEGFSSSPPIQSSSSEA